nr:DUF815 domain-containing protein [Erythrobacter ani]
MERIAVALERLVQRPPPPVDWRAHPAYIWEGAGARELHVFQALGLNQLRAIDTQKKRVHDNIGRFARRQAAHDMLLWGARGMGKSALVRACVKDVQSEDPRALALVQVAAHTLDSLPELFEALSGVSRQFVIFIDDLGFAEDDMAGPRKLRSWLEGGVEARADNCRLAVTSNRRAILTRQAKEQDPGLDNGPLNPRDAVDDKLALADRFGLAVGFHPCGRDEYLDIVRTYVEPLGISFTDEEALAWAVERGQRSGRAAWQFMVEIAGKAGKAIAS